MFTFVTTVTVPTFPDLQTQYNATASQINWTIAIPALGLAVGPLVWSSISDTIGRRVIFIIGTLIAFLASIGAAKASNYSGYMAARFFQGFGTSPASIVGLAMLVIHRLDYTLYCHLVRLSLANTLLTKVPKNQRPILRLRERPEIRSLGCFH